MVAASIQDAWNYGLRAITLIDVLPFIGRSIGEEHLPFMTMICNALLGNEVTELCPMNTR